MRLNRRSFIGSMAILGASAALPSTVRADDSIWDMFARSRVLKSTDREGNTLAANATIETIEPILSVDTAYNLQNAITLYEPFVAAGGWEDTPREVYGLILGNSRNSVIALKRRLMSSADLPADAKVDDMFDAPLDQALRKFQARHGLLVNGQVDEATFYALAVPADVRLNQLKLNLQRVSTISQQLGDRYLVVNIPAASIEAIEGSQVVQRHVAVVGRIDRQTPILHSKVQQINFNPYWHVPKSIIQKDLIEYMKKDPTYLTEQKIHIYDSKGKELQATDIDWNTNEAVNYMFRQEPGAENSMGHVKINFPNPYDVYLHDTPDKSLFGENSRFHSSGCMRVGEVQSLVSWILTSNGGWELPNVQSAFDSNERLDVQVKQPTPIHTTYITAWANRQGTVSFRDDVYKFDEQGKVNFDKA
ncbi:MAG TPA: L,D-transpeptidase family protein [Devosiaceae bacterium]|jgi:murein L,D-transpeptidase YcbB/YkuD